LTVWTFLDEARDPGQIKPGAIVVAGDQDAAAVCEVIDLAPAGDGTWSLGGPTLSGVGDEEFADYIASRLAGLRGVAAVSLGAPGRAVRAGRTATGISPCTTAVVSIPMT
jgi:hypothetical protein